MENIYFLNFSETPSEARNDNFHWEILYEMKKTIIPRLYLFKFAVNVLSPVLCEIWFCRIYTLRNLLQRISLSFVVIVHA